MDEANETLLMKHMRKTWGHPLPEQNGFASPEEAFKNYENKQPKQLQLWQEEEQEGSARRAVAQKK